MRRFDDHVQYNMLYFNYLSRFLPDTTYTLSATAPTLIAFNYAGVDSVQFISFDGTLHQGYSGDGTHFAMDNMDITAVPEPSNYVAGVSALSMLVLAWRKRK
jgi:hypothetical protein